MSMEWLKGLVAPPAQFGQPGDPNAPGGWVSPYATPQGAPPNAPSYANQPGAQPYANQPGAPPYAPSVPNQPAQTPAWAQQQPGGPPFGGMPAAAQAPQVGGDPRVVALETRCNELRHDVDSLALFARTLLTVMMERQILTQQQFIEAKNKIDMLDGKLDDRVAS